MSIGVPYSEALTMPIDFAVMLLATPKTRTRADGKPSANRMVAARRKSKESGK